MEWVPPESHGRLGRLDKREVEGVFQMPYMINEYVSSQPTVRTHFKFRENAVVGTGTRGEDGKGE